MNICDCLNDCGDDPDVHSGKVIPCAQFQETAAKRIADAKAAALLKQNAKRYELLRNIHVLKSSERNGLVVRTSVSHINGESLDSLLDSLLEKINGKTSQSNADSAN